MWSQVELREIGDKFPANLARRRERGVLRGRAARLELLRDNDESVALMRRCDDGET